MPRTLLTILVALLGLTSALAQTAEERADAVKEFKRFFRKFKEVPQQVEAVRTLEGMESADAADELVDLLDHKTPDVARAAYEVLITYEATETFAKHLAGLVDMKDAGAQARLIRVFGQAGLRDALPAMLEVAGGKRVGDEVRYAIAKSMIDLKATEAAEQVVAPLLADGNPLLRMVGAEMVDVLRLRGHGAELVPLLDDSTWQVQSAAVKALGSIRYQDGVTPLIDLMEKGGRTEEECADALFSITGMDFGTDIESWRSTWDRLMSIEGWRIPTDAELEKAKASRKRYDALYGRREGEVPTFGGIPTSSTRILFIIDVSGSMSDLVVDKSRFDAEYEDYEKLTIVKTELQRTIDSLTDNTLFNVVAFATDVDTWKRSPVQANIVNRSSAKEWVRKLRAIGGIQDQEAGSADLAAGKTNTFKALMYPFGVDPDARRPAGGEEGAMENPIDTVFFLSDGRPSTGKHTDVQTILDEVLRLNERYRMVFHTIAIGQFQKSFLQTLAEQNGGVFVDLGQ